MPYKLESQTISINSSLFPENDKPTDTDVAYALATLANWQKECIIRTIKGVYHRELNSKSVIGISLETIREFNGDVAEIIAYRGPDLIITRKMKYGGRNWIGTDEYFVEFNSKCIDSSLFSKLEERILGEFKRVGVSG